MSSPESPRRTRSRIGSWAATWRIVLGFIISPACEPEGAAVLAESQVITFSSSGAPAPDQSTATVSAKATSGLPVRYSSLTPRVCGVDAGGVVTGLASGICTIAADQSGDVRYGPAARASVDVVFALASERLTFAPIPTLTVFDRVTAQAVDSAGEAVSYLSASPAICAVDAQCGQLEALTPGTCRLVAAAGLRRAEQVVEVVAAGMTTVPGVPSGIAVFAGLSPDTVEVRVGETAAGGAPLLGYFVESSPAGLTATGATASLTLACPGGCAGYAFRVMARSAVGSGLPSAFVHPRTRYDVTAVFREPDTRPNDSIFIGSYMLDATTGEVSALQGRLSEAMTGGMTPYPRDTMTWLPLEHQLSSVPVNVEGADALLVATFRLPNTNTLSAAAKFDGSDGWSPGAGMGLHFGYPDDNPGNAYARVFVNRGDPTATPTQAQLALLAYADCTAGGMMGATCMTGTAGAGYGTVGSMSGYPLSQTTTRAKTQLQGVDP